MENNPDLAQDLAQLFAQFKDRFHTTHMDNNPDFTTFNIISDTDFSHRFSTIICSIWAIFHNIQYTPPWEIIPVSPHFTTFQTQI